MWERFLSDLLDAILDLIVDVVSEALGHKRKKKEDDADTIAPQ